jgi:hypothetical protein
MPDTASWGSQRIDPSVQQQKNSKSMFTTEGTEATEDYLGPAVLRVLRVLCGKMLLNL